MPISSFFKIKFLFLCLIIFFGLDYEISHKNPTRNYGLVCLASFTDNQNNTFVEDYLKFQGKISSCYFHKCTLYFIVKIYCNFLLLPAPTLLGHLIFL